VPNLFGAISSRARKRTVHDALTDQRWVSDIRGALSLAVLREYLGLWDLLSNIMLHPDIEDTYVWQFSPTGKYSAKSAYEFLFIGATSFRPWERIWKSWAPNKCKFSMWLAAHNRCWIADHLTRRNLPYLEHCPLCDQTEETIDHLLVSCVFTRQAWFRILHKLGLQALTPKVETVSFDEWWETTSNRVEGQVQQGLNSIIILGAWSIWNHRNRCVFDGISPNLNGVLSAVEEEMHLWSWAGARGVSHLLALAPC